METDQQFGDIVEVLDVPDRGLEHTDHDPRRQRRRQRRPFALQADGCARRPTAPTRSPSAPRPREPARPTIYRGRAAWRSRRRRAGRRPSPACPWRSRRRRRRTGSRAPAASDFETTRRRIAPSGSPDRRTSTVPAKISIIDSSRWPWIAERVQIDLDGDPTEHGVREDSHHEPDRQPDQVASPLPDSDERPEHSGDDGETDDTREQAIDLLDRRVPRGHVDELGVGASRPVIASEPATRQSDRSPGDDNDRERDERPDRDLAVALWRDLHRETGYGSTAHQRVRCSRGMCSRFDSDVRQNVKPSCTGTASIRLTEA